MDLKLTPKKTVQVLGAVMAALVVLHIVACVPMFFMGRTYPLGVFSLDGEHNLPTMFSASLLWCNAVLTGCIAWAKKGESRSDRMYWGGLSVAFLAAGLDESIMFHERVTDLVRANFEVSGLLHYAWVAPYVVLLLLLGLIFIRFFISLPSDTRKHFLFAALLFVGGAIGLEMLGGAWAESHGKDAVYYLLATTEEILEMSGSIAFVYAFLNYMDHHLSGLCVKICSD